MQYVSLTVRACQAAVKVLSLDCRCALPGSPPHCPSVQCSISVCQRMTRWRQLAVQSFAGFRDCDAGQIRRSFHHRLKPQPYRPPAPSDAEASYCDDYVITFGIINMRTGWSRSELRHLPCQPSAKVGVLAQHLCFARCANFPLVQGLPASQRMRCWAMISSLVDCATVFSP